MSFAIWLTGCFFSILYSRKLFTAESAENAEAKKIQVRSTNPAKRGTKQSLIFKTKCSKPRNLEIGHYLGFVVSELGFNIRFFSAFSACSAVK